MFYIFIFFLTMLVQAAAGAALAMFLREWHLEDLRKLRKLQAEEQLKEQNEADENNTENETDPSINLQETENDPTINNNEPQNQTINKIEPENNTTQPEPTENQPPTNESAAVAAENKINDKTELEPQPEKSPVEENKSDDKEIPSTENYDLNIENNDQTENENNQSDYKVDDIISNMLSDNTEQVDNPPETPTSIFDLPFDPTQFDPQPFNPPQINSTEQQNPSTQTYDFNNNENYKNDYENQVNPIEDFGTEFTNTTNESDKNNQIDFSNSPNEFKNSNATTSTQNISQTAVEILGENFDFNSLLAASKVVDNSETKTIPQQTNPNDYNFTNVIESVAISPLTTEFFTQQSQEITTTFTPNMIQKNDTQPQDSKLTFTESPPPIYIRKNKRK